MPGLHEIVGNLQQQAQSMSNDILNGSTSSQASRVAQVELNSLVGAAQQKLNELDAAQQQGGPILGRMVDQAGGTINQAGDIVNRVHGAATFPWGKVAIGAAVVGIGAYLWGKRSQ